MIVQYVSSAILQKLTWPTFILAIRLAQTLRAAARRSSPHHTLKSSFRNGVIRGRRIKQIDRNNKGKNTEREAGKQAHTKEELREERCDLNMWNENNRWKQKYKTRAVSQYNMP